MIKVNYTELDGPAGPTCRLEASGHAGYAPAGQDIVCAGASTLMQTLCALLAGEEGTRSGVWDEPDGPRLAVTAAAPQKPWVEGAFEFAKARQNGTLAQQLARMQAQMAQLTGLLEVQKKSEAPKLSGPAQELSTAAMARAMKTQKGEMR